jgi:hypothetical protein
VKLVLELMETLHYQWVNLDFAEKASILSILARRRQTPLRKYNE